MFSEARRVVLVRGQGLESLTTFDVHQSPWVLALSQCRPVNQPGVAQGGIRAAANPPSYHSDIFALASDMVV